VLKARLLAEKGFFIVRVLYFYLENELFFTNLGSDEGGEWFSVLFSELFRFSTPLIWTVVQNKGKKVYMPSKTQFLRLMTPPINNRDSTVISLSDEPNKI